MESSGKELKINHFVFRQPDRRSSISGQLSQCWTLWHTAPGDIFILFVVVFCFYTFCLTPSTRCHILLIVVVVVFFGTQHQAICIVCCFCFVLYVFVWQPAPGVIVCLLLLFLLVFDIVAFVFFKFLFGTKQPGDIYYCCCCCFLLLFLFCFSCFCLAPSTRCHILLVVVVLLFGTHGTKCYCVKHILLTLEPK